VGQSVDEATRCSPPREHLVPGGKGLVRRQDDGSLAVAPGDISKRRSAWRLELSRYPTSSMASRSGLGSAGAFGTGRFRLPVLPDR